MRIVVVVVVVVVGCCCAITTLNVADPLSTAPGKISLLVLVQLYAEFKFPNNAILPVLTFVIKHLVRPKDTSTFVLGLDEIKDVTINEPSTVVGRTIFDLLLKGLWHINSFDALHSFFEDTQTLVVPPEKQNIAGVRRRFISPTSILGCFVRRAHLEFVRLQFNEVNSLWRAFVQFRDPTLPLWKKRVLGSGPMSFDQNLEGMTFNDLAEGQVLQIDDVKISTARGNHPNGVWIYRVDHGGKSIVYATDTEHYKDLDPALLKVASGVDVLIYDSQYTPEEYTGSAGTGGPKVGWGHSTFDEAVKLATAAKAKKLVLFHHDPLQNDAQVRAKEKRAQALFANSVAAYEGLVIDL